MQDTERSLFQGFVSYSPDLHLANVVLAHQDSNVTVNMVLKLTEILVLPLATSHTMQDEVSQLHEARNNAWNGEFCLIS